MRISDGSSYVCSSDLFADTTLIDAATNNTPLELTFGYEIDADHRLTFIAHEVYLPKPKLSISGPGGIQATFEWQSAKATSALGSASGRGSSCTYVLISVGAR